VFSVTYELNIRMLFRRNSIFEGLTLALYRCEWTATRYSRFTPGERIPIPISLGTGWAREAEWVQWGKENRIPLTGIVSSASSLRPASSLSKLFPLHNYYVRLCYALCLTNALILHSFHWDLFVRY
jgi:hypothetical protein